MRPNALYFPYISLPTTRWTVQSILYWDRLKSIVPFDQMVRPERLQPQTRELLEANLLDAIVPGMHLHSIREFGENFVRHLQGLPELVLREFSYFARSGAPGTMIHVEKLAQLPDDLCEMGFARVDENHRWAEMHPEVARRFMFYLASVLSAMPEVNANAVTDKVRNVVGVVGRPRSQSRASVENDLHVQKAREVMLNLLLPLPDSELDVAKLVKFKEKHGAKLPRLRELVERAALEVALQPSAELKEFKMREFVAEAEDQIAQISAAMKVSWSRVIGVQLLPVIGSSIALTGSTMAANADPNRINLVSAAGAAVSLGGSIIQAVDNVVAPVLAARRRPLAYVAQARACFGGKT